MSKTKTNPTDSPAAAPADSPAIIPPADGLEAMSARLAGLEDEVQNLRAKVEEMTARGEEPETATSGGDNGLLRALINHYEAQYSEGAKVEILDALYALDGREVRVNEFAPANENPEETEE